MNKIQTIFSKHWEYYCSQGAETLKQQSGQIQQVAGDYQGRVLYELLQNALDKAENEILVKVDKEYLYVANNGERFTFTDNYDYTNGESQRGDFQSLCSISTSTKDASNSIGNKGVGFKSVYSLNRFADIFVKPKIKNIDVEKDIDDWVSFRVYDEINNEDKIKDYICNTTIEAQLKNIQKEYSNRGIPGFYYPILLDEKLDSFAEYVTVVRVKHNDKIDELITELKSIHLKFISLKYKKDIKVKIDNPKDSFELQSKDVHIVFTEIHNISELSSKTTQEIKTPKVAIFYKNAEDKKEDLIYNYMPTKVVSPFKNLDFHGDFQSTIDRKGIDLDKGDIAKYNKALLQACIELHFLSLSSYVDNDFDLRLEYINKNNQNKISSDKDSFWKYLQLNDEPVLKKQTVEIIKNIFKNDDNDKDKSFSNFFDFISKLAVKYFNEESSSYITLKNLNDFWQVIFDYFDIWRGSNGSSIFALNWIREKFQNEVLYKIKNIKCTPITAIKDTEKIEELIDIKSLNDHIFYKKENKDIVIPKSVNISLTQYNFLSHVDALTGYDEFKELKLKKFTNYNELLKHFRQIPKDGKISSTKKISEDEQINILNSIFQIYLSKKESNFITTHRYEEILSNKANIDYTKIAADFAVSTIFLKVGENKYKPAQYCYHKEIREDFLNKLEIPKDKEEKKNIDDFLKFLGVSFDDKIRYMDFFESTLESGLNYIPGLIEGSEEKEQSSYISNMKIKYNNIIKHPSLFYKSPTYDGILDKIASNNTESLNIVVKKLEDYPESYINTLVAQKSNFEQIKPNVVFKFYQIVFKKYSKKYLIYKTDGTFDWFTKLEKNKHFIAKTKEEFELLKDKVDILATFSDVSQNDTLKEFQEDIVLSIEEDGKESENIKTQIGDLIPYILLSISNSDNESRKDFLEADEKEFNKYLEKWQELKFKQLETIQPKIKISNIELESKELSEPIMIKNVVYHKSDNSLGDFSAVIADFLNVGKLKTEIEIILLKKEKSKMMFESNDIEAITSKWIKIDLATKNSILDELKRMGFKNDISFKLTYTKLDLKQCDTNDKTQKEIQDKIDQIKKPENLRIVFNCEDENKSLIDRILSKYETIELQIDEDRILQLSQRAYLTKKDVFDKLGKTEQELDEELSQQKSKNLSVEYRLNKFPQEQKEEGNNSSENKDKKDKTATVSEYHKNTYSARNMRIAQKRGLKIEEKLVEELADSFKSENLIGLIKDIFGKIKGEKLLNSEEQPRFDLKNKDKYQNLLDDKHTKLSDLLHMSKTLGDGLGFDILYPTKEGNRIEILKVEVKSSSGGNSIYLSENERKQILLYEKDENFRIFLYIKENEPLDITSQVINILKQNELKNMTAETWIIELKGLQNDSL